MIVTSTYRPVLHISLVTYITAVRRLLYSLVQFGQLHNTDNVLPLICSILSVTAMDKQMEQGGHISLF